MDPKTGAARSYNKKLDKWEDSHAKAIEASDKRYIFKVLHCIRDPIATIKRYFRLHDNFDDFVLSKKLDYSKFSHDLFEDRIMLYELIDLLVRAKHLQLLLLHDGEKNDIKKLWEALRQEANLKFGIKNLEDVLMEIETYALYKRKCVSSGICYVFFSRIASNMWLLYPFR